VIQQFLSLARILAGNAIDRAKHAQGTERDVLEIADWGGNQVQTRSQRQIC
jgi:hypothetical protein